MESIVSQFILYFIIILIPLFAIYIGYLIITKAFKDMGFSSFEAILIIFVSFILGYGILDGLFGIKFSNIHIFTYGDFWNVGVNAGGAIIPIVLSIYLAIKNKLKISNLAIGTILVAIITYFVTEPNPEKGIVSKFPYWILPIIIASLISIILSKQNKKKAAPLAYISGTIGVLIGADIFHLITLLNYQINTKRNAIIGGASVFDMIFITGILAVIIDGILLYQNKKIR